jgi:AraC family transcriptional regulator
MENFGGQANYAERLTRVTSFIMTISTAILISTLWPSSPRSLPTYWHRIYQAVYGESVVATVKRLRLQRAAVDFVADTIVD